MAHYFVTRHALGRYRIHHPAAEIADVISAIQEGSPEDPDLIQAITRRGRSCRTSQYVSSRDGRGIFVLVNFSVITYLRLMPSQQRILGRGPLEEVHSDCENPSPKPKMKDIKAAALQKRREEAYYASLAERYQAVAGDTPSDEWDSD